MFIDFHSHILPGIDDGSRTIDESIEILDKMADDQVDIVIATPHFYPHEISAEKFLKKRDEAYERLKPYLKPRHPEILLGAEVLFSSSLIDNKYLSDLCIQGTEYLLLEMPYVRLTRSILDGVEELIDSSDLKFMIAHVERYLSFTDFEDIEKLMSFDVIGQLNAKSFEDRKKRKNCLKLLKKNFAHVIGTDFHRINRGDRPLSYGYDMVAKKMSDEAVDMLLNNAFKVIKNRDIDEIIG
ncbi:MAG: histidinol-phosphatase [Ruminococcus sp.]|nr:histidinol-phosphatase [Ruminococcus sp.]